MSSVDDENNSTSIGELPGDLDLETKELVEAALKYECDRWEEAQEEIRRIKKTALPTSEQLNPKGGAKAPVHSRDLILLAARELVQKRLPRLQLLGGSTVTRAAFEASGGQAANPSVTTTADDHDDDKTNTSTSTRDYSRRASAPFELKDPLKGYSSKNSLRGGGGVSLLLFNSTILRNIFMFLPLKFICPPLMTFRMPVGVSSVSRMEVHNVSRAFLYCSLYTVVQRVSEKTPAEFCHTELGSQRNAAEMSRVYVSKLFRVLAKMWVPPDLISHQLSVLAFLYMPKVSSKQKQTSSFENSRAKEKGEEKMRVLTRCPISALGVNRPLGLVRLLAILLQALTSADFRESFDPFETNNVIGPIFKEDISPDLISGPLGEGFTSMCVPHLAIKKFMIGYLEGMADLSEIFSTKIFDAQSAEDGVVPINSPPAFETFRLGAHPLGLTTDRSDLTVRMIKLANYRRLSFASEVERAVDAAPPVLSDRVIQAFLEEMINPKSKCEVFIMETDMKNQNNTALDLISIVTQFCTKVHPNVKYIEIGPFPSCSGSGQVWGELFSEEEQSNLISTLQTRFGTSDGACSVPGLLLSPQSKKKTSTFTSSTAIEVMTLKARSTPQSSLSSHFLVLGHDDENPPRNLD